MTDETKNEQEQPAEEREMTAEELEAQGGEELPDREAMSLSLIHI